MQRRSSREAYPTLCAFSFFVTTRYATSSRFLSSSAPSDFWRELFFSMPLFSLLSRVTSEIDAQESAELLRWRRCGDRAAPSPRAVFHGRGALLWSIYPRADIKRLCKAQFCGTLTLSSIVIRCFNHCLQTTLIMFCECNCFSGNEQFIAQNISFKSTLARGSDQPMLATR